VALVALAAVTVVAAEPEQQVEDVGNIMVAFGAHLDDHPLAGAEDLYKFLHQAVYGPGHAIPNREAAAAWLEREKFQKVEDPGTITRALRLTFVAKYFERIGDQATNICELIVYMTEARVVKHSNLAGEEDRESSE